MIVIAAAAVLAATPTLWLIGDSTVRNGSGNGDGGQWGWGDRLASHFDPAKVTIRNRAIGGRSSRTFLTQGRWDAILAEARPGDFVMMQFGHNDPGPVNDDSRARGSLPGIGEETQEIDNLLTKQRETVHTFGWYLRRYIRDAKARGMHPIVCTYIPRCPRPGAPVPAAVEPASYRLWAQQVARIEGAACIDLYERVWRAFEPLSPETIKSRYFCDADYTHLNDSGARLAAEKVVEGLRALPGHPLAAFLASKE